MFESILSKFRSSVPNDSVCTLKYECVDKLGNKYACELKDFEANKGKTQIAPLVLPHNSTLLADKVRNVLEESRKREEEDRKRKEEETQKCVKDITNDIQKFITSNIETEMINAAKKGYRETWTIFDHSKYPCMNNYDVRKSLVRTKDNDLHKITKQITKDTGIKVYVYRYEKSLGPREFTTSKDKFRINYSL